MEFATHDGITVGSNTETAAEIQTMLEAPDVQTPEPEKPAETPVAAVPEATPAADETTERNADGTFKKRNRRDDPSVAVQSAIGKQREAERRADALAAELAALKAPKPAAPPQQTAADAEPNPDDTGKYPDGQFDRKFLKDQARWEARQEIQATQRASREQWERDRTAQDDRERGQVFQDRLAKARAADPAFDSKLDPTLPMSAPMQAYVADSEFGPQLLVHLSAHREDTQRLATLHPIQVIRELAKLEARWDAAAPGPAPVAPVSNAKAPIQPVGTSPHIAADDGSDDEPVEKHFARENARDLKAGRR